MASELGGYWGIYTYNIKSLNARETNYVPNSMLYLCFSLITSRMQLLFFPFYVILLIIAITMASSIWFRQDKYNVHHFLLFSLPSTLLTTIYQHGCNWGFRSKEKYCKVWFEHRYNWDTAYYIAQWYIIQWHWHRGESQGKSYWPFHALAGTLPAVHNVSWHQIHIWKDRIQHQTVGTAPKIHVPHR